VSEAVVEFGEAEDAVGVSRVNGFDHLASLGVAEIEAEREAAPEGEVGANVVEIGEFAVAVGGTSVVTEGPGLEGASAAVPEIVAVAEPESVDVAADSEIFSRAQDEFAEKMSAAPST